MASDGVFRAVVSDVVDPLQLGRVELRDARGPRAVGWVPVATVAWLSVGDEVLAAHEDDDPARPVVIGSLRRDSLKLRFGGSEIVLGADGAVRIEDASGNTVVMAPAGITINAAASVAVQTPLLHVSANEVTVDAAMSTYSGVVQCETLIANSVIAPT